MRILGTPSDTKQPPSNTRKWHIQSRRPGSAHLGCQLLLIIQRLLPHQDRRYFLEEVVSYEVPRSSSFLVTPFPSQERCLLTSSSWLMSDACSKPGTSREDDGKCDHQVRTTAPCTILSYHKRTFEI